MSCIIEITATIQITSEGGGKFYFKMGEQYCFSDKAVKLVDCYDCGGKQIYIPHYKVLHPLNQSVICWVPKTYAVEVDKSTPEEKRNRQLYYLNHERIGFDTTTDFIGQAKKMLGIDTYKTSADIATDPDVERGIGAMPDNTEPSVNESS